MSRTLKASLLFCAFAVCALAFLVAYEVEQANHPPQPHDLFAVVQEQLSAFRAANYQSAYRQAASGVQQKFTLPQFEKMVRRRYPEMTQAGRVEFGLVDVQGTTATVQVFFFAADRSVRSFLYSLTREDEAWRIDGVEELESERRGESLAGTQA